MKKLMLPLLGVALLVGGMSLWAAPDPSPAELKPVAVPTAAWQSS